ncbi:hypothetical protein J2Y69_000076 [Microbacterium resistens]|uniref:Polyketide cyclase / dehydrase and lipid transport n=1 Tax=Microbacterium resistens TaxID=156977 RepID=A0ABU1S7B6_9MICO|nr:hypothetical protein [Microbacterium resistens]MDR6865494.1 hypothetical protein [Microbacterium resistens]
MNETMGLERLSQIQDEILQFTWRQVADKVDKFYIQGKIVDDGAGHVTMVQGSLKYVIRGAEVLNNSDVISKDDFRESSQFVTTRIEALHDLLLELQGRSPVRFRWSVDTQNRHVDSEWTYYQDLTEEEKKDDFWKHWKGDFAWKAQLEAELAGQ